MLPIKILIVFITSIFCIIFFSLLFFLLGKLPKAEIEITYKPIYKPSIPLYICQIIQNKFKCLDKCIEGIKNEISKIFKNFEIVINGKSIKVGDLPFSESYECIVNQEKIIIKVWRH